MAEATKKRSWIFPSAGPGTLSGFFVAWAFVAAIIGVAILLMNIGKGPLPLRVVGYDISVGGEAPTTAQLDTLIPAIRQANAMVLALHGSSEKTTTDLALKLEIKPENTVSQGSSGILSRYEVERSLGGGVALIRFAKIAKFGIVSVDLRESGEAASRLKEVAESAVKEFGKTPHAILAQAGSTAPDAPEGYVVATATNQEATDWRLYVPKEFEDNLKECYVPADNDKIKAFSEQMPIVARFVFHKKDFQ